MATRQTTRMVEVPCEGDVDGEPFSYTLTEVDDLDPDVIEGEKVDNETSV